MNDVDARNGQASTVIEHNAGLTAICAEASQISASEIRPLAQWAVPGHMVSKDTVAASAKKSCMVITERTSHLRMHPVSLQPYRPVAAIQGVNNRVEVVILSAHVVRHPRVPQAITLTTAIAYRCRPSSPIPSSPLLSNPLFGELTSRVDSCCST